MEKYCNMLPAVIIGLIRIGCELFDTCGNYLLTIPKIALRFNWSSIQLEGFLKEVVSDIL